MLSMLYSRTSVVYKNMPLERDERGKTNREGRGKHDYIFSEEGGMAAGRTTGLSRQLLIIDSKVEHAPHLSFASLHHRIMETRSSRIHPTASSITFHNRVSLDHQTRMRASLRSGRREKILALRVFGALAKHSYRPPFRKWLTQCSW